MAAYPMQRAIAYFEFLEKLKAVGVEIKESQTRISASEETIKFLEHKKDGAIRRYPLTFAAENEFVQWSVIRSVCSCLELDPALFGLHIG